MKHLERLLKRSRVFLAKTKKKNLSASQTPFGKFWDLESIFGNRSQLETASKGKSFRSKNTKTRSLLFIRR